MIVNYTRMPYRRTGRHGSRVQRANACRRRDWRRAQDFTHRWPGLSAPEWLRVLQDLPGWLYDPNAQGASSLASYDVKGRRIGMLQASLLTSDIGARRIGLDQVGDYEVSTVHLAEAVQHTADGRPLIFETAVFHMHGEPGPQLWRTTTRERAQRQHAEICDKVRRGELE